MNRTAALCLIAGSLSLVAGVALFSPRVAVLVLALMLMLFGFLQLDLGDRE